MVYTLCMETKVFQSGNSLAVRLPKSLNPPRGRVSIHREGKRIIIEETTDNGWPDGFFDNIRITRKDFGRTVHHYQEKTL